MPSSPALRAVEPLTLSGLKVLGLIVAVTEGFCEESIFRLLASAAAFGLVHGVWGQFRGSLRAALGATLATVGLGLALAAVFVASHRVPPRACAGCKSQGWQVESRWQRPDVTARAEKRRRR